MVVLIVFGDEHPVLFDAAQIQFVEGLEDEMCVVHTAHGGRYRVHKRADLLFEEIAIAQKEEYVLIPLDEVPERSTASEPLLFAMKTSSS